MPWLLSGKQLKEDSELSIHVIKLLKIYCRKTRQKGTNLTRMSTKSIWIIKINRTSSNFVNEDSFYNHDFSCSVIFSNDDSTMKSKLKYSWKKMNKELCKMVSGHVQKITSKNKIMVVSCWITPNPLFWLISITKSKLLERLFAN